MLNKFAINELIEFERFCRDNALWQQMHGCYSKDSRVTVSRYKGDGCGFVEESSKMKTIAPHRIYNTLIWLNSDRAVAVTMAYTEQDESKEQSVGSLFLCPACISDEALLTPATVNEILVHSGRDADFLHNPEAFLERATEIIRDNRHALAIDGIKYIKLDGKEYYAQEIFDTAKLIANLDRNAVKVDHSVLFMTVTQ